MTQVSPLFRAMAWGDKDAAVRALVERLAEDEVQKSNPIVVWDKAQAKVEEKQKAFQEAKAASQSGWDEDAFLELKRAKEELAAITGGIVSSQQELEQWSESTATKAAASASSSSLASSSAAAAPAADDDGPVALAALLRAAVQMNRPESSLLGRYERTPVGMFWLYSTANPVDYALLQRTGIPPVNDREHYWGYNTPAAWDPKLAKEVIGEMTNVVNTVAVMKEELLTAAKELQARVDEREKSLGAARDKLDDAREELDAKVAEIQDAARAERERINRDVGDALGAFTTARDAATAAQTALAAAQESLEADRQAVDADATNKDIIKALQEAQDIVNGLSADYNAKKNASELAETAWQTKNAALKGEIEKINKAEASYLAEPVVAALKDKVATAEREFNDIKNAEPTDDDLAQVARLKDLDAYVKAIEKVDLSR